MMAIMTQYGSPRALNKAFMVLRKIRKGPAMMRQQHPPIIARSLWSSGISNRNGLPVTIEAADAHTAATVKPTARLYMFKRTAAV